jgi:uncharacterized MAPEG superfamily protein
MTEELCYLAAVSVFTALLWVPYILNTIMLEGLVGAVGYPVHPKPLAPWARRLKKAHYNAVESLVVFAALVLVANAAGVSNDATVAASMTYFWARVVHPLAFTLAIPWVRTLSFVVAWGAQLCIAWQILM